MKKEHMVALVLTVIISFNILLIFNSMKRIGFGTALITFSILFFFLSVVVGFFFIHDLKKNNNLNSKTIGMVLVGISVVSGFSIGGAVLLFKLLALAGGYSTD
ncbi:hypothetical protein [Desulfotomaculum sp. 1211_IL3151]|uniref:hypothetical protein n=1 Tax=Desulfotomaculum sp. 1211_IL3151 TaxID=3084055 RepID=UPI002FDB1527